MVTDPTLPLFSWFATPLMWFVPRLAIVLVSGAAPASRPPAAVRTVLTRSVHDTWWSTTRPASPPDYLVPFLWNLTTTLPAFSRAWTKSLTPFPTVPGPLPVAMTVLVTLRGAKLFLSPLFRLVHPRLSVLLIVSIAALSTLLRHRAAALVTRDWQSPFSPVVETPPLPPALRATLVEARPDRAFLVTVRFSRIRSLVLLSPPTVWFAFMPRAQPIVSFALFTNALLKNFLIFRVSNLLVTLLVIRPLVLLVPRSPSAVI